MSNKIKAYLASAVSTLLLTTSLSATAAKSGALMQKACTATCVAVCNEHYNVGGKRCTFDITPLSNASGSASATCTCQNDATETLTISAKHGNPPSTTKTN